MKIHSCRFECAARRARDEPRAPGALVALLGRSNVGKSSLINRLLGAKGLARTSSAPGRTQSLNFYRVNERWSFVDLPGYGYADVPEAVRRSWRPMVEGFLRRRAEAIALALLVVDARHEPGQLDLAMRDWLDAAEIDYVVAATKSDKLSGNGRAQAARTLRRALADSPVAEPILVSARTGLGMRSLWRCLDRALGEAPAHGG